MGQVDELRRRLVLAIRVVHQMGLFELNSGHLSVRVPGEQAMLILGHLHTEQGAKTFEEVDESDICRLDLSTFRSEGEREPADEFHIHSSIYARRPEVQAVVHTHAWHPVAMSIANQPILPVLPHGLIFAPAVPTLEDHRQVETRELGDRLAETLGDGWAVMLRAHGPVTVGTSLEEAVAVMYTLDQCARAQLLAASVGQAVPISAPRRQQISANRVRNIWRVFTQRLPQRAAE